MSDSPDEQFQYWLAQMDDSLERFFSSLPPDLASRLDYSIDSLPLLEKWWLDQHPSTESAVAVESNQTLDSVARYLGETLRINLGGKWCLNSGDPEYAFNGIPEVEDLGSRRTVLCPLSLATAALDRRKETYWLGVANRLLPS